MASAMINDNHVASSSQADTNSDMDEPNESITSMERTTAGTEDEELEEIKARVREMEEEAEKLKQMQDDILANSNQSETPSLSPEEKAEIDARSIFVGNVDYSATADDLEKHFHGCGSINRVTILCDKYSGHPKGFAYIEFGEKDSVETATALDDSLFKGRQIKVCAKRTNRPGMSSTNRPPRGRGVRGRGFGRGSYGQSGGYVGGGSWNHRSGRRPFRARGWHGYSPY